jgi:hypothetical protein
MLHRQVWACVGVLRWSLCWLTNAAWYVMLFSVCKPFDLCFPHVQVPMLFFLLFHFKNLFGFIFFPAASCHPHIIMCRPTTMGSPRRTGAMLSSSSHGSPRASLPSCLSPIASAFATRRARAAARRTSLLILRSRRCAILVPLQLPWSWAMKCATGHTCSAGLLLQAGHPSSNSSARPVPRSEILI